MNVHDVCDYIILKLREGDVELNLLKLQKLLYYVQAWHLAFYNRVLFPGKFQAWVHGPVNRPVYDRFKDEKSLYSFVGRDDVRDGFDISSLPETAAHHINAVLEVYAPYSGTDLEDMTHREDPWLKAREGFRPSERCEREIDETLMARYYASRLKH